MVDWDWDVVVIGAGAAGFVAAFRAAERGRRTLLLEKNRKPGAKILMSGGTRCNLTHATDKRGILCEFGPQGRFLHSALSCLGPEAVVEMFEAEGVATKIEPVTGKIFPASNKALDVLGALVRRFERSGATLVREEPLLTLDRCDDGFRLTTPLRDFTARQVILACGGQSYPGCGTTGDGYRWAAALGHRIVPPRPALVPIRTDAVWVHDLSGMTIPDVFIQIVPSQPAESGPRGLRPLAERRGSFLFTHFGFSGPVVLDVSRAVSGHPSPQTLSLVCDFLPNVKADALDALVARQCAEDGRKQLSTILGAIVPQRLAERLVEHVGVPAERRAAELSKSDRLKLVAAVKQLAVPISGTLGFKKAEVTAGGVALEEIDSRTMQSRIVPNLFVVGELLDLDGPIGGYNFQSAFSTGWLAGESVS